MQCALPTAARAAASFLPVGLLQLLRPRRFATDDKENTVISRVTGTPLVETHHPRHRQVFPEILRANSASELLRIFHREHSDYGWLTAKETITRISRHAKRASSRARLRPS